MNPAKWCAYSCLVIYYIYSNHLNLKPLNSGVGSGFGVGISTGDIWQHNFEYDR